MIDVGPNFDVGERRIARRRLPEGLVAILGNREHLRLAIRELRAYCIDGCPRGRRGLVFRLVSVEERQSILYRLQNLLGVERFVDHSSIFHIPEGRWHVMDTEHVTHILKRHGESEVERGRGHTALSIEDFEFIPEVIHPKNIFEFVTGNHLPRIRYRREYEDRTLVAIEEIRGKGGVALKTF
jgi:hypothetical protein